MRVFGDRAAVMWETDSSAQSGVEYETSPSATARVVSEPFEVTYKQGGKPRRVFIHKAWMKELPAGKTQGYRIFDGNEKSPLYAFKTPAANSDKVRFAVYGDSRGQADVHRRVIRQIIKADVDFVIHTGDFVNSGTRYEQWQEQFFDCVKGLAEHVPFYTVKGNHDAGGFYERFFMPDGQRNYTINRGPLYYFLADNTTNDLSTADLLRLLAKDSARDDARWRFISWHEPNLNLGGHMSDRGNPYALPIISTENTDFVIAGHSHMYERFRPLSAPAGSGGSVVTYMTTGGGGADLADVQPDFLLAQSRKQHHFCLFEITGDTLVMTAINMDGEQIDGIMLSKHSNGLDSTYAREAVSIGAVILHQEVTSKLTAYTHSMPAKGETFEATLKISKMKIDKDIEFLCQPRWTGDSFEHTGMRKATAGAESGEIKLRFQVRSSVDADLTYKKHLEPPLYMHCEYDSPYGKAWTSVPVEYN